LRLPLAVLDVRPVDWLIVVVSEVSTRLAAAVRAARTAVRRGPLGPATDEVPQDDTPWPAALLDPAEAVVPFMGREQELDELRSWAESSSPISLRLVIAPAGFGKTRLASEFGSRMGESGWTVVPVPRGKEAATARARPQGDVLFVVDNAATRFGLGAMFDAVARPARGRTRILLLAHVGGEWLRRLRWGSTLWAQLERADATHTTLDLPLTPGLPDLTVLGPPSRRSPRAWASRTPGWPPCVFRSRSAAPGCPTCTRPRRWPPSMRQARRSRGTSPTRCAGSWTWRRARGPGRRARPGSS
jgi:hypothetical protein